MTKNVILNISIIVCKVLGVFYVLAFVVITAVFVHYQLRPSFYKSLDFVSAQTITHYNYIGTSYKIGEEGKVPSDNEVFNFTKLKTFSLYFNFVKYSLVLLFSFLCVKEFQRVIQSVKRIKTFQTRNVRSFRKIAKYQTLILFLIGCVSFNFEKGGIYGFHLSVTVLLLMLLAFILAEIFREGNKLAEEKELTI